MKKSTLNRKPKNNRDKSYRKKQENKGEHYVELVDKLKNRQVKNIKWKSTHVFFETGFGK